MVSRSNSSVPSPAFWSVLATCLFLGLFLLLPLPCAKSTIPGLVPRHKSPSNVADITGMRTCLGHGLTPSKITERTFSLQHVQPEQSTAKSWLHVLQVHTSGNEP